MITFVCGQLCSGKTVYSKALCQVSNATFIEVGDIVRQIKQTTNRRDLQDSKHLSDKIVKQLKEQTTRDDKDYVVCGVRQKEILENFKNSTLLWIECPFNIRKGRYEHRQRSGDSQTFEDADKGDIDLGILEVKKYIFRQ